MIAINDNVVGVGFLLSSYITFHILTNLFEQYET